MTRIIFMMIMMTFTSGFIQQLKYGTLPVYKITMSYGKGFGGGEATRDPKPTNYDPNDPKGKQTAIFKAESYAEYLAKRSNTNNHGVQTGQDVVVKNTEKKREMTNAESYANYMAKRKANYMKKFENPIYYK